MRQNRKLFRMLTPRNAIAALNELHGQSVNESTVVPTPGNKFEAEITINNVRYLGTGTSKMQAKNAASEKALRDLVINKFQQVKNQEVSNVVSSGDDVNMETDDKADDVPMLQLASFALHKLFSEWEAEGFEIPLPKANVSSEVRHECRFSTYFQIAARICTSSSSGRVGGRCQARLSESSKGSSGTASQQRFHVITFHLNSN